jgi:hypothetical protein
VPIDPRRAQDEHGPTQAEAQQTPCAQCPLAQSSSVEQMPVSEWLLQVPPTQAPFVQSSPVVQLVPHRVPVASQM